MKETEPSNPSSSAPSPEETPSETLLPRELEQDPRPRIDAILRRLLFVLVPVAALVLVSYVMHGFAKRHAAAHFPMIVIIIGYSAMIFLFSTSIAVTNWKKREETAKLALDWFSRGAPVFFPPRCGIRRIAAVLCVFVVLCILAVPVLVLPVVPLLQGSGGFSWSEFLHDTGFKIATFLAEAIPLGVFTVWLTEALPFYLFKFRHFKANGKPGERVPLLARNTLLTYPGIAVEALVHRHFILPKVRLVEADRAATERIRAMLSEWKSDPDALQRRFGKTVSRDVWNAVMGEPFSRSTEKEGRKGRVSAGDVGFFVRILNELTETKKAGLLFRPDKSVVLREMFGFKIPLDGLRIVARLAR